jgi:hypothetical protein
MRVESLTVMSWAVEVLPASSHSNHVIDLLLSQPLLLDNLRKAHMGNYGIVLSLLGCLDNGLRAKKLVDKVIDACMYSYFMTKK